MKNWTKISFAIAFFASLTSSVFAQTTKSKDKKVPYVVANRYFVKNTVEDGIFFYPKITSQDEFNKLFGMATVMGKNGMPTPIDFSKQYVVAIIDAKTSEDVKLEAKNLVNKDSEIIFTYSKTEVASNSSTFFRHCLIVIIDSKYQGEVKFRNDKNLEYVPFTVAKRYFVNNTVKDGVFFHPKITSQEEFDKLFGMAPVMGENGSPTHIDFSKQYVIAVIDSTVNKNVDMDVKSLLRKDGEITLTYSRKEISDASSAFFRHCLIVIVDNNYKGEVKINH